MIIVNADDFGASSDINSAIVDSIKKGICSSTTIMANMPAFDEACELTCENTLNGHIGIHLVLSRGVPLTDKMKLCEKFCDSSGSYKKRRKNPIYYISQNEKIIIASEFSAQIEKCRKNGISITHIDSHHHIHNDFGIFQIVIELAKKNNIQYIRRAKNIGQMSYLRKKYNNVVNYQYEKCNVSKTQFFGSIQDYKGIEFSQETDYEIMIHPNYINGELVDINKRNLETEFASLNIKEKLSSYTDKIY